jgi:hypothetical protein
VSNPSFEGTAALDLASGIDAPPWTACDTVGVDVFDASLSSSVGGSGLAASQGSTYLRFLAPAEMANGGQYTDGTGESVSEALCAPMRAGATYGLKIDLATDAEYSVPTVLEVWGATASCSEGELLGSSPVPGLSWSTDCVTLKPAHDATYLTLRAHFMAGSAPSGSGPTGVVYADNLVAVSACP